MHACIFDTYKIAGAVYFVVAGVMIIVALMYFISALLCSFILRAFAHILSPVAVAAAVYVAVLPVKDIIL